jgi:uncharacterized protein
VDDNIHGTEIDTVLLKVASRCNINCSYCYVYHMGDDNWSKLTKFMSDDTISATLNSLAEIRQYQDKYFSVVLHGGEPLLLGAPALKSLFSGLRSVLDYNYPISIQTNGILITTEILEICSANKVSIAVSIDGPKHVHDKLRLTHNGEGTFDAVIAGIKKLRNHSDSEFLNAGLLAVIDPESDPHEVYTFFKSMQAPSVDFLYKDGNHDRMPNGKSRIDSIEYGKWMVGLLNSYLADDDPLPIRVIDDMLKVLLGGIVSKEGLGLTDFGIIIIDTDGTVMKNDTLKSSYNGADKFENPVNVKDGGLIPFLNSQAFTKYKELQRPTHKKCLECPQLNICGGGMILHRWKNGFGFNNPSVYCSDQLYLIAGMRDALSKIYLKYA